jgi:hypothetical protein
MAGRLGAGFDMVNLAAGRMEESRDIEVAVIETKQTMCQYHLSCTKEARGRRVCYHACGAAPRIGAQFDVLQPARADGIARVVKLVDTADLKSAGA